MDGCQSWKTVARVDSEGASATKTKVAGTQQIDRCWNHLQIFCPSQMKNHTGPTINARFWDRIYQWIYRHNCLNETWRPHARCKKRLLKLFVVWCRNWSLKKWQNVRRFGIWMSKTHGCVNPCYHGFVLGMCSNLIWAVDPKSVPSGKLTNS